MFREILCLHLALFLGGCLVQAGNQNSNRYIMVSNLNSLIVLEINALHLYE